MDHLLKLKSALVKASEDIFSLAEKESRKLSDEEMEKVTKNQEEIKSLNSQIELARGMNQEEKPSSLASTSAVVGAKTPRITVEDPKEFESTEEWFDACLFNQSDPRLKECYVTIAAPSNKYRSEQSVGTGASGGFMMPAKFNSTVRSKNPGDSLVRPNAQVLPEGGDDRELTFPALDQNASEDGTNNVFGGVKTAKIAEGGLIAATEASLRLVTMKPHEFAAYIPFTDQLLRNWGGAGAWASNLLRQAMASREDFEFIRGNGVGGPRGIIDHPSTLGINRQTAGQVNLIDFQAMFASFRGNLGNAAWHVSYTVYAQLLAMVGQGGGATNVINVNQGTGAVTIYGLPVIRHTLLRNLGSRGDVLLTSFEDYLILDGHGPIVDAGFATGQWERNKRSIKITWNVDGNSWLTEPFTDEGDFVSSSAVVLDLPLGS